MNNKALRKLNSAVSKYKEVFHYPSLVKGKPKFFCIGRNKTGTTSLARAFKDLGYIVGNQRKAERLLDNYVRGEFDPIVRYCRSAEVFQDVPFSYPELYKHLDKTYPDSKFILTVRDSPEQWYRSLTRFHSKLFGHGAVPSADQLKNAQYVHKGWIWKAHCAVYPTSESDPYNEEILTQHYMAHNEKVMSYFSGRNCLLVINLSESGAYQKFCHFIGAEQPTTKDFPWENKTKEVKTKL